MRGAFCDGVDAVEGDGLVERASAAELEELQRHLAQVVLLHLGGGNGFD